MKSLNGYVGGVSVDGGLMILNFVQSAKFLEYCRVKLASTVCSNFIGEVVMRNKMS